ncbi:MAG: hypothetical protein O4803_05045 [Trichodesmium sp. St15_bin1_1]|nr:hypothetical protein [Trichodesmium sp. MAG_R02]MDE5080422.1 hypothetical protein [Trichodesmium sp. St18_bin1]MDE5089901.1 hypothetical protein [Trichodesmium sp. St16_bin2-tuft]MDE5106107.1 hypothetical protein [Trichodesmium sp. St17_bin3_1_1]MDE5109947.1 hypothetical protein [Trichodesmium sp. St7_bin2_1]MDE5113650.1 hypothetical protein [Trichodesmium sp. St15_bin1_1]MDE5117013.1 hypothetical protein [Trichodesmium sp. St2_bin2_1]MDE5122676.1 hypothetical protein [Trichodesmium sp. S
MAFQIHELHRHNNLVENFHGTSLQWSTVPENCYQKRGNPQKVPLLKRNLGKSQMYLITPGVAIAKL